METHLPPSVQPIVDGSSDQERTVLKKVDSSKKENCKKCESCEPDLLVSNIYVERKLPSINSNDVFVQSCLSSDNSIHSLNSSFSYLTDEHANAQTERLQPLLHDRLVNSNDLPNECVASSTDQAGNVCRVSNSNYPDDATKSALINCQNMKEQLCQNAENIAVNKCTPGCSDLNLFEECHVGCFTTKHSSTLNQTNLSSLPNLEDPLLEMLKRHKYVEAKYIKAIEERDNLLQKLTTAEDEKVKTDIELKRLLSVNQFLRSKLVKMTNVKIEVPLQLSTTENVSDGEKEQKPVDFDESIVGDIDAVKVNLPPVNASVQDSKSTEKKSALIPEDRVLAGCTTVLSESKPETLPAGQSHDFGKNEEVDVHTINNAEVCSCCNRVSVELQGKKIANLEDALQVEKQKSAYLESRVKSLQQKSGKHNQKARNPESDTKQVTIVQDLQIAIEVLQQQMVIAVEDFEKEKSDKAKIASSLRTLKNSFESLTLKVGVYKQQLAISCENLKKQKAKINVFQQNINHLRSELQKKDRKISELSEKLWYFQRLSGQQLPPFVQVPQPGVADTCSYIQNYKTTVPSNFLKWACSVCTYSNTEPRTVCEMCGKLRNYNDISHSSSSQIFFKRPSRLVSRGLSTDEGLSNRLQFDPDDCDAFSTHSM